MSLRPDQMDAVVAEEEAREPPYGNPTPAPSDGLPHGPLSCDRPVWSRDGQEIFHLGLVDGTRNLWTLPAEGGPERQLTDLQGRRGAFNTNALSTDGEYLYFVWQADSADIWVMDVVQDDGSDD